MVRKPLVLAHPVEATGPPLFQYLGDLVNQTELHNAAVAWLVQQSRTFKLRPNRFTPKEVAEAVGGGYTLLGRIAEKVAAEVTARGIPARYVKTGLKRHFELL
jgi:hypothetical protein